MDNNMQCLSDAHIAEVLKMLPYVSREDVKKDLAITNSVELTINRILDGQLTQESSVASGELSEDGAAIKQDDSPPHYTLSTARVTTVSSFACELPSPPKKRKFVFRQIDRSTAQKRNDFYSDSSDVELNDVNEQCEVELNHDTLGSASVGVNLNNLSDDDTEQTDQMKLSTHGCCVTEEQQVYKSEKSSHIVQYISSDEDVSEDGHTETVEAHCAVDSGYSRDYSKTSSHVNGFHVSNAMSRHLVNCSSAVTETCDDLPDLNMDSGSCFSHGDSQTSTQSTTLSQTSVFSESGSVTSTSCLNSQDPELPTLGCARKLAKTSEKATGMQKMEREKTKAMKKEEQESRRKVREEERVVKQQKREEVQREKAFEKSKKQAAQAARRQVKPGECLKFMTAVIDPAVLKTPGGSTVLETLQKSEVKYEIVPQPLPNTVTFWREVTEVTETEPLQLQSHTREVVEKQILLVLPLVDFIELVHATQKVRRGMASEDVDTLTTYMQRAQDLLEGRQITLLIQGLEGYFRDQKTREDRAFRGQVLGNQGVQRARSQKEVLPSVTRLDVEEVLLDLQMHCQCNVKLLETDAELGKMVLHYTRAIAETPFKKDRLKTCFTFHVDKKWCVKVDKEGHGLATLWRQQLQQFKNVSADMANAIVAEYPSPWLLYQAYKKCPTNKSAEELLQDILVRRGAGVLSTSRRIGKELSRRIHQILTVTDPSYVIS